MKKYRFWGKTFHLNPNLKWGEEIFEYQDIYLESVVKEAFLGKYKLEQNDWNKLLNSITPEIEKAKKEIFWQAIKCVRFEVSFIQKYAEKLEHRYTNMLDEKWLKENEDSIDWSKMGSIFSMEPNEYMSLEYLHYLESKIEWKPKKIPPDIEDDFSSSRRRRRHQEYELGRDQINPFRIPWVSIINRYIEYFEEDQENEPYPVQFIKKYKDRLDWKWDTRSIEWTPASLAYFKDCLSTRDWILASAKLGDWDTVLPLLYHLKGRDLMILLGETSPPLQLILERYESKINWRRFLDNPVTYPWKISFIKKCEETQDYDLLCTEKDNFTSIDFVEKHVVNIDFVRLSQLKIPFDAQFLRFYEHFLDWKYIGLNNEIDWTEELVLEFEDKWTHLFWYQYHVPFTEKILMKYGDQMDLSYDSGIVMQDNLEWTLKKLQIVTTHIYESDLAWLVWKKELYQQVFEPYLDETLIEEVLETINERMPSMEIMLKAIN